MDDFPKRMTSVWLFKQTALKLTTRTMAAFWVQPYSSFTTQKKTIFSRSFILSLTMTLDHYWRDKPRNSLD